MFYNTAKFGELWSTNNEFMATKLYPPFNMALFFLS